MIGHAFKENMFPLPKEKMPQHEEWTEEEKGEEYIPPKERPEIIAQTMNCLTITLNIKVQAICMKI